MTPFLRGHGGGGEGTASATRLGYPRQARLLALKAKDEPHPTLMRTPAAPLRGAGRLCQEQSPGRSRYSCVPRPVASQRRRAHLPRGRGQLGKAHGWGGSSGDGFLLRGGPAGVGRTWDGASAPSPYSVRQPRADLVSSSDPPPGRGPVIAPRSEVSRARPASHQTGGLPGLRPRTPAAGSRPTDDGVSSLRLAPWAPVRPRLAGRPVAQGLTKRLTSKTSFVCSMW